MQQDQMLGHYKIKHRLGQGGMGEVYLAEDTRLMRNVAVKVLPESLHNDPLRMRRFRMEAIFAARLNHPNIATIYSVEDDEPVDFITMEYVDGHTFGDLISHRGLSIDRFRDLFIPLAGAFEHAHNAQVVHRDIKPGNLMLSMDGLPKILDFGMAHLLEPLPSALLSDTKTDIRPLGETAGRLTSPGQTVGTPAYMSPEQTQGQQVDHRSDIFSLGVVMYEMVTGQRPFTGQDPWDIMASIRMNSPRLILELRPDIPISCVDIIDRCLEKDPVDRYQSMADVRAALDNIDSDNTQNPSPTATTLTRSEDNRRSHEKSVEIARAEGNPKEISKSLIALGGVSRSTGDYEDAKSYFEESLEFARASGEKNLTREVLWNMGDLLRTTGEFEEARLFFIDSLKLALESGENVGRAMWGLGMVALAQGVYDEARTLFDEALGSAKMDRNNTPLIADLCFSYGRLAEHADDPDNAVFLLLAASGLYAESETDLLAPEREIGEIVDKLKHRLNETTYDELIIQVEKMNIDALIEYMAAM